MMRYGRNLKPLNTEIKYIKTVYGGNSVKLKRIQSLIDKNNI